MSQAKSEAAGQDWSGWFDARLLELDLDRIVTLRGQTGADAKLAAIDALVARLDGMGLIDNRRQILKAIYGGAEVPSEKGSPGEGGDPVFAYVISSGVREPAVIFARSEDGLEWDAGDDSESRVVFFIALPPDAEDALEEMKTYLNERLEEAGETLRKSRSPKRIVEALVP